MCSLTFKKNASPVALHAQESRSCLCADEVDASTCIPSCDDVAGGPILHAPNCCFKTSRVTTARSSVVVPQHEVHDVVSACQRQLGHRQLGGVRVELAHQAHPKHHAHVVVPGCTAQQRSGTHTESCGGALSRRLHSAAAEVKVAAVVAARNP